MGYFDRLLERAGWKKPTVVEPEPVKRWPVIPSYLPAEAPPVDMTLQEDPTETLDDIKRKWDTIEAEFKASEQRMKPVFDQPRFEPETLAQGVDRHIFNNPTMEFLNTPVAGLRRYASQFADYISEPELPKTRTPLERAAASPMMRLTGQMPTDQELAESEAAVRGFMAGAAPPAIEQTSPKALAMWFAKPVGESIGLLKHAPTVANAIQGVGRLIDPTLMVEGTHGVIKELASDTMPSQFKPGTEATPAERWWNLLQSGVVSVMGARGVAEQVKAPAVSERFKAQQRADTNAGAVPLPEAPKPPDWQKMGWVPEEYQPMPPAAAEYIAAHQKPGAPTPPSPAAQQAAQIANKHGNKRSTDPNQTPLALEAAQLAAKQRQDKINEFKRAVATGDAAAAEKLAKEIQDLPDEDAPLPVVKPGEGLVYSSPTQKGRTSGEGVQEPLKAEGEPLKPGNIDPNTPEGQAALAESRQAISELEALLQGAANEANVPMEVRRAAADPEVEAARAADPAWQAWVDAVLNSQRRNQQRDMRQGQPLEVRPDDIVEAPPLKVEPILPPLQVEPEPPIPVEPLPPEPLRAPVSKGSAVQPGLPQVNPAGEPLPPTAPPKRKYQTDEEAGTGNIPRPPQPPPPPTTLADLENLLGNKPPEPPEPPAAPAPPVAPPPPKTPPAAPPAAAAPVRPADSVQTPSPEGFQPDSTVVLVPPEQVGRIGLDPKTYQFKESEAKTGKTGALAGVTKWNPKSPPITVHQRADGSLWVADGHQRLNLYRELLARGEKLPPLRVEILREADGYTAEVVRRVASIQNVMEGSAKPLDIAKLLRLGPLTEGERAMVAKSEMRGANLRHGEGLAQLSDEAFQAVVNGEASPEAAAQVAKYFPDAKEQLAALRLLGKRGITRPGEAEAYVASLRDGMLVRKENAAQGDLFGGAGFADLAGIRAKLVTMMGSWLVKRKNLFATALKGKPTLEEAKFSMDEEAGKALGEEAGNLLGWFKKYADQKGTATNTALRDLTQEIYAGTIKPEAATDRLAAAIRRDIETGGGGGAATGPSPVEGQPAGARSAGELPPASEGVPAKPPADAPLSEVEQILSGLNDATSKDAPPLADVPFDLTGGKALGENAPPPTKAELEAAGQQDMFGPAAETTSKGEAIVERITPPKKPLPPVQSEATTKRLQESTKLALPGLYRGSTFRANNGAEGIIVDARESNYAPIYKVRWEDGTTTWMGFGEGKPTDAPPKTASELEQLLATDTFRGIKIADMTPDQLEGALDLLMKERDKGTFNAQQEAVYRELVAELARRDIMGQAARGEKLPPAVQTMAEDWQRAEPGRTIAEKKEPDNLEDLLKPVGKPPEEPPPAEPVPEPVTPKPPTPAAPAGAAAKPPKSELEGVVEGEPVVGRKKYRDSSREEYQRMTRARNAAMDAAMQRGQEWVNKIKKSKEKAEKIYEEKGADAVVEYWEKAKQQIEKAPVSKQGFTPWERISEDAEIVAPPDKDFVAVRLESVPDQSVRDALTEAGFRYNRDLGQWIGNTDAPTNRRGRPREDLVADAKRILKASEGEAVGKDTDVVETPEQQQAALDAALKNAPEPEAAPEAAAPAPAPAEPASPWTESGKADSTSRISTHENGRSVETYYDRKTRSWVTVEKDPNGYQVGDAEYVGTKEGARMAHEEAMKRLEERALEKRADELVEQETDEIPPEEAPATKARTIDDVLKDETGPLPAESRFAGLRDYNEMRLQTDEELLAALDRIDEGMKRAGTEVEYRQDAKDREMVIDVLRRRKAEADELASPLPDFAQDASGIGDIRRMVEVDRLWDAEARVRREQAKAAERYGVGSPQEERLRTLRNQLADRASKLSDQADTQPPGPTTNADGSSTAIATFKSGRQEVSVYPDGTYEVKKPGEATGERRSIGEPDAPNKVVAAYVDWRDAQKAKVKKEGAPAGKRTVVARAIVGQREYTLWSDGKVQGATRTRSGKSSTLDTYSRNIDDAGVPSDLKYAWSEFQKKQGPPAKTEAAKPETPEQIIREKPELEPQDITPASDEVQRKIEEAIEKEPEKTPLEEVLEPGTPTYDSLPQNVKTYLRYQMGLSKEAINKMTVDEAVEAGRVHGEERARAKREAEEARKAAEREAKDLPAEDSPLESVVNGGPLERRVRQWLQIADKLRRGEEVDLSQFGDFARDLQERMRRAREIRKALASRKRLPALSEKLRDEGFTEAAAEAPAPKVDEATVQQFADFSMELDSLSKMLAPGKRANWTGKFNRTKWEESFPGGDYQIPRFEQERLARMRNALLDKGTPEALEQYADLLSQMQDRIMATKLRNNTGDNVEGPVRSTDPNAGGEYLGSGLGGFEKVYDIWKNDRPLFYQLLRTVSATGGAMLGYEADEEHPLRGLMTGLMIGLTPSMVRAARNGQVARVGQRIANLNWDKAGQVIGLKKADATTPVRRAPNENRDLHLWELLLPMSTENVVPKVYNKAMGFLREFNDEIQYGNLKESGVEVRKASAKLAVREAIKSIREAAVEAKQKGYTRKAKYLDEMANAMAKKPTGGQVRAKQIGEAIGLERLYKATGRDAVPFDWVESMTGSNAYRVLTGWGVDSAMQNLTQPVLALKHVTLGDLAWAYSVSLTKWARDMTRHTTIKRPTDLHEELVELESGTEAQKKAVLKRIWDDRQLLIAKSDNFNRRVVYLAALRQASQRGLMGTFAKEWSRAVTEKSFVDAYRTQADVFAQEVMRDTQGDVGPLAMNPYWRGPIAGSLRPFIKYPTLLTRNLFDLLTTADGRGRNRYILTTMVAVMAAKKLGLDLEDVLYLGGKPFGIDAKDPVDAFKRIAKGEPFPVVKGAADLFGSKGHITGSQPANHVPIPTSADEILDSDLAYLLAGRYPVKLAKVGKRTIESDIKPWLKGEPRTAHAVRTPSGAMNPQSLGEDLLSLTGFKPKRVKDRAEGLSDVATDYYDQQQERKSQMADLQRHLRYASDAGDNAKMAEVLEQMALLSRSTKAPKDAMKGINRDQWERIMDQASPTVKAMLEEKYGQSVRDTEYKR